MSKKRCLYLIICQVTIICKNQNEVLIPEVKEFIKKNFGSPPNTPILDIPEEVLLGVNDHIIVLKDIDKNIVGCVRYHFLGLFVTSENEQIYCVDCFTVHKKWRRKGIGDYLLTSLHNYVNKNNIPYSMFLKEGRNLPIVHNPIYTSTYAYREIVNCSNSENIKELTVTQAYRLMDLFREINPGMFIVRNIKSNNQMWKLYKKGTSKILACFQNPYQTFEKNGKIKKIGWVTGWIESPDVTDEFREEASRELSASMYPMFDYIWMNNVWCGDSDEWKTDGLFHWYSYQWSTCVNIKKSYCILN
jgi:GNAT superfamily N-acetyltransferase